MIFYLAQFFNLILFGGALDSASMLPDGTDQFPHVTEVFRYFADLLRYVLNQGSVDMTFDPTGGEYVICYALAMLFAVLFAVALWKLLKKVFSLGNL